MRELQQQLIVCRIPSEGAKGCGKFERFDGRPATDWTT